MESEPEQPVYINKRLNPPTSAPHLFKLHHPDNSAEVRFDPRIHLQLELPKAVKTLDFKTTPFPYSPEVKRAFPGLAYTQPFRLLSDEGVKAMRTVIDMHKDAHLKPNERNHCIRGLGFLSQFTRDFAFSEEVAEAVSDLAQEPLGPHNLTMNHAHTNFGFPGKGKAPEQWHVDSVDYVFVLILSDITDMQGGELQVLQMADASGNAFDELRLHGIPDDLIENVSYAQAGFCIFCQGSKILHSVTPVLSAREPRISIVQSWNRLNVFAPDSTLLTTFREQVKDPLDVTNFEYARHKAWRVEGQMKYLIEQLGPEADVSKLAKLLEEAGNELLHAKALLLKEKSDFPGFIVNKQDTETEAGKARGGSEAVGGAGGAPNRASLTSLRARL